MLWYSIPAFQKDLFYALAGVLYKSEDWRSFPLFGFGETPCKAYIVYIGETLQAHSLHAPDNRSQPLSVRIGEQDT